MEIVAKPMLLRTKVAYVLYIAERKADIPKYAADPIYSKEEKEDMVNEINADIEAAHSMIEAIDSELKVKHTED